MPAISSSSPAGPSWSRPDASQSSAPSFRRLRLLSRAPAVQSPPVDDRPKLAAVEPPRSPRIEEPKAQAVPTKQNQAALIVAPPSQIQSSAPSVAQKRHAKRDADRLARLRVSQAKEELIKFERELGSRTASPVAPVEREHSPGQHPRRCSGHAATNSALYVANSRRP